MASLAQANILAGGVPGVSIRRLCGERERVSVRRAGAAMGADGASGAALTAAVPRSGRRAGELGRLCAGAAGPGGGRGGARPRSLCAGAIGGAGGRGARAASPRSRSASRAREGGSGVRCHRENVTVRVALPSAVSMSMLLLQGPCRTPSP